MRFAGVLTLARKGTRLAVDSRAVAAGDIFVALPGPDGGGERFVEKALAAGAAAVVAQNAMALSRAGSSGVLVPDAREALGQLAAAHFGTEKLPFDLVGLTGTNGKTTVTYLLEHTLAASGRPAGVIGTVGTRWPGGGRETGLTTPGCLVLHEILAEMGGSGAKAVVMEVSSHALAQNRIAGLAFNVVALTNVTQDHLDYHGDMESYFAAKALLFSGWPGPDKPAAINFDDPYGRRLLDMHPGALGYGLGEPLPGRGGDLHGRILEASIHGLHLEMQRNGQTWRLRSPMIGAHNAANLMTAQAVGLLLGLAPADFASLADCPGAPGRLERVDNPKGLSIFVDYAHTPDALTNVLAALRPLTRSRLVAIFGCGGNRDRGKRPLMGQAAAALADKVILTSDNPRFEDPETIMDDVMPGLSGCAELVREGDRARAIGLGLEGLGQDDVLLIAGKGHETYQEIHGVRRPFHDAAVAKEILGCA